MMSSHTTPSYFRHGAPFFFQPWTQEERAYREVQVPFFPYTVQKADQRQRSCHEFGSQKQALVSTGYPRFIWHPDLIPALRCWFVTEDTDG